MKTKVLLTVTALVLLAGCQKFGGAGRTIRFSAVTRSDAAGTKTAYTGDVYGGSERIDWSNGDVIRIYSNNAVRNNDNSFHWADYTVGSHETVTETGIKMSKADISAGAPDVGLAWTDATSYDFYGIYPAPGAADAAATVRGVSGTPFNCSIPAAQTGTPTTVIDLYSSPIANTTVYYPPMANAYMVAHATHPKDADIVLQFDPAYTAFHISVGAGDAPETAKEIKSVTLTSTSTELNGDYTAYYDSGWNYNISGTGMTATFTFSDGNYIIPVGGKVEFVIFALPQVLTDLTLTFTLSDDSTRSLKLKKNAADTETNAAGYINFAPCKKHYIKGLLIPNSTWSVNNSTPVILRETAAKDWDDESSSVTYGTDPVVNASGLDEVDLGTHSYRFSIYEPEGQTWKIKVLDPSGNVKNTVTVNRDNLPGGSSDPVSGSGELTGLIRGGSATGSGLVEFHLSGSTGGADCTLSFSIITGVGTTDEHEYSINSEVVRGSWGTGYSYINF